MKNVFHKVTLESLKKNKTRTAVTIVGIILSTAMICAVASLASSFQDFLIKSFEWERGAWHVRVTDSNLEELKKLDADKHCDTIAYGQTLGYAKLPSKNTYKPYLYVMGISDGFTDLTAVHISKGRLPKNESEILLPEHLAENGGVSYKLGDTISLELGHRMHSGQELFQTAPFQLPEEQEDGKPETIENAYEKSFVVVGFYERPTFEERSAPGYTALTLSEQAPTAMSHLSLFATATHPYYAESLKNLIGNKAILNARVLQLQGFGFAKGEAGLQTMLFSLVAIILALILFAAVALIYNAFSISVSERTKQFGLLSSLGATKKQLRKSVYFEAFVLSGIGIPIGILAGLLGIGITLHFVGNRFEDFLYTGYPGAMTLSVSPLYILGAALLSLLTVLLSARRPAKRATKVSAMDAIRQTTDIRDKKAQKKKAPKTSKLVYKCFGFPGMLADKNYKRSRKKYRTTVLSLSMSIILFVSAFSFTDYLMLAAKEEMDAGSCDIETRFYLEERNANVQPFPHEELLEIYQNLEHVDSVACTVHLDHEYRHHPALVFVDDEAFKTLLTENLQSMKDYTDKVNPKALVYESMQRPKQETNAPKDTGQYIKEYPLENGKLTLSFPKEVEGYRFSHEDVAGTQYTYVSFEDEAKSMTLPKEGNQFHRAVTLGTKLKSKPYFLPSAVWTDALFFPMSMKDVVVPQGAFFGNSSTDYAILAKNHKEAEKEIWKANSAFGNRYHNEHGTSFASGMINNADNMERQRNMILLIQVFCYGFVTLLSLVSATNVFNTISTNIGLRRREFAMLQSVGMTKKEMHRMMTYECLQYGAKSLLIGIPISLLVTVLIHLAVHEEFHSAFLFPWLPILISFLCIFALVFATMLYSMRKIAKQNTIETLKDENQ